MEDINLTEEQLEPFKKGTLLAIMYQEDIKVEVAKFLDKPCKKLIKHLLSDKIITKYKILKVSVEPDRVEVVFKDESKIVYNLVTDERENENG